MKRLLGLITTLTIGLLCGAAPALAITVQGTLHSTTHWTTSMSPVTLVGDVTVSSGVTLTIDPGVKLVAATNDAVSGGADSNRVELIVKGTVTAVGSAGSLISFTGASSSKGSWYGIRVLAGGVLTMQHATIRSARYSVANAGTATLTDVDIGSCSNYAVWATAGNTTVVRAKLHHCGYGYYTTGGTNKVSFSQIYRNTAYGVYGSYSSSATSVWLDHNTIVYNSSYGVYSYRSSNSAGAFTLQSSIVARNSSSSSSSGYEVYSGHYATTCRYNLLWDTGGGIVYNRYSPNCSAALSYNPLFVNAGADDYRLFDRSPARKMGAGGSDAGALPWTTNQTGLLHGYLFKDHTIMAGSHTVVGDLVIPKGVNLVIEPGATLLFKSSDDMAGGSDRAKPELIVYGTLSAKGVPSQQIHLRAESSSTTKGAWYGIRVMSGGRADLQYASVRGARYGVESYGTANLGDTEVAYCSSYGIYTRGGGLVFEKGRIHRNQYGVYATGGSTKLSYVQVFRNTSYGVYGSYSSSTTTVSIDHSTIVYNSSYGVYSNRSSRTSGAFTLQNSIVARNSSSSSSSGYEVYSGYYDTTCKNNLIWDTGGGTIYNRYSPNCGASVSYNPLFVNSGADDFRLYNRSPARKAGIGSTDLGALAWTIHQTGVLHGKLFKDHTIPVGIHTVTGDLIVAKGVTLTIDPGAVLKVNSSDDMYGGVDQPEVELVVEPSKMEEF